MTNYHTLSSLKQHKFIMSPFCLSPDHVRSGRADGSALGFAGLRARSQPAELLPGMLESAFTFQAPSDRWQMKMSRSCWTEVHIFMVVSSRGGCQLLQVALWSGTWTGPSQRQQEHIKLRSYFDSHVSLHLSCLSQRSSLLLSD